MRTCFAIFPRTTSASGGEALRSCQLKPCMSSDLFERLRGVLGGGVTGVYCTQEVEAGRWQMRDQLLAGPSRPQAEERAYSNWLWMCCLGLSSVVSRLPAVLAMTAAAKNSEPRPRKICKHEMKERPYFSRISQALVAALVPACASLV